MGHAIHPNYTSKHEDNHAPKINGGVVIKTNAKQRYASDAVGSFIVKKLIEKKNGRVQEYEVRNDMCVPPQAASSYDPFTEFFDRACGSTVGPFLSKLGVRVVDIGLAMLSMHSIRETAGSHDAQHAVDLFTAFFEDFTSIDQQEQNLLVD